MSSSIVPVPALPHILPGTEPVTRVARLVCLLGHPLRRRDRRPHPRLLPDHLDLRSSVLGQRSDCRHVPALLLVHLLGRSRNPPLPAHHPTLWGPRFSGHPKRSLEPLPDAARTS